VKLRGRIHQGVRGTHSNGRVIRDGSIPPSHVGMHLFFFLHLSLCLSFTFSVSLKLKTRTVKARSYVQYSEKRCVEHRERIRANQLHFIPATCRNAQDAFHIFFCHTVVSFVDASRETLKRTFLAHF